MLLFASHECKGLGHRFGVSHLAKLAHTSKDHGIFISFGFIITSFVTAKSVATYLAFPPLLISLLSFLALILGR